MYSFNKKVDRMIRELVGFIEFTIEELADYANVENPGFYLHEENEVLGEPIDPNSLMTTIANGSYTGEDEATGIISHVKSVITMKEVELYRILLTTEMDMDETKAVLHLALRHEMGHVIDFSNFIGRQPSEWHEYFDNDREVKAARPKLRKNASVESRIRDFLRYNHICAEVNANKIAGITDEDWIDYWCKLTKCEKPRKIKEPW